MATENIMDREPARFAANDTLYFERFFPTYIPSDGWYIRGTLTDKDSGKEVAQFVSAADPNNPNSHLVKVPNWAQGLAAKEYILSEEIVNDGIPAKHQIFYNSLTLTPDFDDKTNNKPVLTTAERMLMSIRKTLERLYERLATETEAQRTRIVMQDIEKMRKEENYWCERRTNEIQTDNALNGRPAGNVSRPIFYIGA